MPLTPVRDSTDAQINALKAIIAELVKLQGGQVYLNESVTMGLKANECLVMGRTTDGRLMIAVGEIARVEGGENGQSVATPATPREGDQ